MCSHPSILFPIEDLWRKDVSLAFQSSTSLTHEALQTLEGRLSSSNHTVLGPQYYYLKVGKPDFDPPGSQAPICQQCNKEGRATPALAEHVLARLRSEAVTEVT